MNVNLLPNKSRLEFRKLKMIGLVKKSSFIFVGVFLLILVVTFSLNIYYSSFLKKNTAGLLSVQSQYGQFANRIDELQSVRFRVKMAAGVLDKRRTVGGKVEQIKRIIGEETVISKMKVDYKEGDIQGTVVSYTALSLFEKIVED